MTFAPPTDTPLALAPLASDVDVVFEELAPHQWRVLDARVSQSEVTALLGFVCITAGVYEVTQIAHPLEVTFCPDVRAARASFID